MDKEILTFKDLLAITAEVVDAAAAIAASELESIFSGGGTCQDVAEWVKRHEFTVGYKRLSRLLIERA